jgi:hypothetical protein
MCVCVCHDRCDGHVKSVLVKAQFVGRHAVYEECKRVHIPRGHGQWRRKHGRTRLHTAHRVNVARARDRTRALDEAAEPWNVEARHTSIHTSTHVCAGKCSGEANLFSGVEPPNEVCHASCDRPARRARKTYVRTARLCWHYALSSHACQEAMAGNTERESVCVCLSCRHPHSSAKSVRAHDSVSACISPLIMMAWGADWGVPPTASHRRRAATAWQTSGTQLRVARRRRHRVQGPP